MKRIPFFISTLLLTSTLFSSSGFAQDYVHYVTLIGHTGDVYSVSFSPNGTTLASGGSDQTIRLWNAVSGEHEKTLSGHTWTVWSVSFSPDGRTLASASHDQTIQLWDTRSGINKKTLIGHTTPIYSVSFSSNGRILASAGGAFGSDSDKTIRLWDPNAGVYKKNFIGHVKSIESVCFSPDSKVVASGSWDFTVRLWDVSTGKHLKTLTGHIAEVTSVSFAPDGLTLASGGGFGDNTVRLWDATTGQHKGILEGHTGSVQSVCFSPDGKILASGSGDWTVCLWDAQTGKHKITLTGHTSDVKTVAFSPDGNMLASGSMDKTVRLWKNRQSSANQVYDNAIRSVMWMVNPRIGEGSGVLIDKKFRLAITNAHITGTQNTVNVYFPAPDENGELIKDRNFYLKNNSVLKRLGYYTKGHVVAKNTTIDLAIIKLDGLPETASEIDWNFTTPTTNAGDLVYILGNPGGQDLWRWTLGEFLNDQSGFLHIQSDVFGGNSGGPVLNKQGVLLGIIARSDRHMNALAIPVKDINRLLSESQLKHSRSRR